MAEEVTTQNPEVAAESATKLEEKPEKAEKTFTREDLNRIVAAEKEKAVAKAIAEHERLAKMTNEERAKERMANALKERNEREKSLLARERAIAMKEMQMQTEKELIKRELPSDFASFLVTDNADTTKQNLDSFEKSFRGALQKAVEERVRGKVPPKTSTTNVETKSTLGQEKKWNRNK